MSTTTKSKRRPVKKVQKQRAEEIEIINVVNPSASASATYTPSVPPRGKPTVNFCPKPSEGTVGFQIPAISIECCYSTLKEIALAMGISLATLLLLAPHLARGIQSKIEKEIKSLGASSMIPFSGDLTIPVAAAATYMVDLGFAPLASPFIGTPPAVATPFTYFVVSTRSTIRRISAAIVSQTTVAPLPTPFTVDLQIWVNGQLRTTVHLLSAPSSIASITAGEELKVCAEACIPLCVDDIVEIRAVITTGTTTTAITLSIGGSLDIVSELTPRCQKKKHCEKGWFQDACSLFFPPPERECNCQVCGQTCLNRCPRCANGNEPLISD